jgi:hypothetical protein
MANSAIEAGAKPARPWLAIAKVLAVCTAAAVVLVAAFVALLALAISLPSDARIAAHIGAAADSGVFAAKSYPKSPFGHGGHRYDMYTDCVAFGMNLNSEGGLLQRIAASPTAGREGGDGPCEDLVASIRAGNVKADAGYLRFWHGYQVYTRPLMSIMPMDALLRTTAMLFYGVLIFFAWQLHRLFGPWAWPVALLPFFALSDFLTAPMVVTHALSLATAFLPAALVPGILARIPNARAMILPVFVFAAGAISSFLNFLINPPLAPALIAFVYIACCLNRDERQTRQTVLYAMGLATLWLCGFAAAWLGKWVFAILVLGPDVVIGEVQRTVDKYGATAARLQVNFLGATKRNLLSSVPFTGYILASFAAALAILAWTIRKHGALRINLINFLAMLAPLVVILVWAEVNKAHSSEHVGFVSRTFLLFGVFPMLAAIKLWRDRRQPG